MTAKHKKAKLFRVTTVSLSLDVLLKGQLRFLDQYFDVTGIANGVEGLNKVREREGIKVLHVPMRREISVFYDLVCLIHLFFIFLFRRPHIVHANTPKGSLLSMMAAFFAGIPHRLYTVTGLRYQTVSGMKRKILILTERLACLFATKVIPEGNGVKHLLERDRITGKELIPIHHGNINGVDTGYFRRSEQLESAGRALLPAGHKFTFLFAGRLVKDKGIGELIHAFKKFSMNHPDSRLVCLGDFEEGSSPLSEEVMTALKQDEMIFAPGFQEDVRAYMAVSDVFVFPSYREGFPNVLLQACSMALPVIATDITGSNEIIEDGKNGFLVPVQNADALADKMELLYGNPELCKDMGRNGRQLVENKFKQEDVWQALLAMYNNLN